MRLEATSSAFFLEVALPLVVAFPPMVSLTL